jgi:CHAT domain-containing protein
MKYFGSFPLFLGAFFSVLVLFYVSSCQNKFQRKAEKVEYLAFKGKAKTAYKKNEKLLNKILSSGNVGNEPAVLTYMNRGKLLLSTGRLDYERSIQESMKLCKETYKDTGRVVCNAKLQAAETHFQYGHYRKAKQMLGEALATYQKTPVKSFQFLPQYYLLSAKTHAMLGYLAKADSCVTVALPLLEKRIVKYEPYTDKKGRVKKMAVLTNELLYRKQAYAWATTYQAYIAFDKGMINAADSLFNASNKWIQKNMGKSSPAFAFNQTILGQIQEDKGNIRKAYSRYDHAFQAMKSRQDQYYFNTLNKMLYGKLILGEFKSTPTKTFTMLERKTKMYDNKNNIFFVEKELLEEWFAAKKYKNNNVEGRLDGLMAAGKIPKLHADRIRAHQTYLLLDSRNNQRKSMEDTMKASLTVMKELYGEETPAYHRKKLELANFYFKRMGNLKAAEDIYSESFDKVVVKEMSPLNPQYVWYYNDIGNLEYIMENFSKSASYLMVAEKQAKVNYGGASPQYAIVLSNMANVYINTGKYTQAKDCLDKAQAYLEKGDRDTYTPSYALAYQNIAEGYTLFGLYEKAEKALKRADDIMDDNAKKGYDRAENSSPDDMAAFYLRIGKIGPAEKLLKQSITEKEKSRGKNARELIKPLNLLGKLYYTTGDYGQSEIMLNRAAKISTAILGDSSLKYAESLKTLQKLYAAFGDYQKAEQTCLKQMAINNRILGNNNVNTAEAMTDLAFTRYYLGANKNDCRNLILESNRITKGLLGEDNPIYINGLKNLSYFQIETGQMVSADSLINASESYWTKKLGKNNIYTPEFDHLRGDYYRKLGKYDLALEKYNHALDQYKSSFSSKHPLYVSTLSKIAKTYYSKGDFDKSLDAIETTTENYYDFIAKYFPVLSFGEKSKYWDMIKGDFEFFNSLAIRLSNKNADLIGQMYDYQLATKALLLSNSIKVRQRILSSGNKQLIDNFNTWNDKKELLTKSVSYNAEQLKQEGIDQSKLEKEIEELEKQLSTSSEEFSQGFENKSFRWKDVKKALKDNEAAVEIIRFRYYKTSFTDSVIYAALIVTNQTSGNPEMVVLPKGREMEKKYVKYYRNTIKYMNEDEASYDVFWKQVDAKIAKYKTVYLSSEGVYNQINVETFEDANEIHIIDKYDIVLVSNTKDLALKRLYEKKKIKKTNKGTIALVGNPQFYVNLTNGKAHSISQLQGAEVEATEISSVYEKNNWNNNLMLKLQAEEERFKNLDAPKILHVATHGYFQPDARSGSENDASSMRKNEINPLYRSGLLLAGAGDILDNNFTSSSVNSQDGILTAFEAMNMNLDGTELVTLSACETGLGDIQIGEGVAGLQRSFLVAGAENVIMSLFKVNDEITEKLMLTFYSKWLKLGDKRQAFLEAKREIKLQHPESIYWGSFIMVGLN